MGDLHFEQLETIGNNLDAVVAEAPEGMTSVTVVAIEGEDGGYIARAAATGPEVPGAIIGMLLNEHTQESGVTQLVYEALREHAEYAEFDTECGEGCEGQDSESSDCD